MPALKLCLMSSEILPYAKTGGLADVAGALVWNARALGYEVHAFMPLYAQVRAAHPELAPVLGLQNLPLAIGASEYRFSVCTASYPGTDAAVYFIGCPELYDRGSFYTTDPDEHRRFLLFTRATLESCRRLEWAPDIFHCNDWHTAFVPLYLKTSYAEDPLLRRSRSVMTIHNIGYQGVMPSAAWGDLMIADGGALDADDLGHGVINPLKTGIRHADRVTTVSPTYAREIREGPLGMGMQDALQARGDEVVGILNGVDYREWDPRNDPHLSAHFGPEDLRGKRVNKEQLIGAVGLDSAVSRPLIGMVTRLAEQKGIDLLFDALPALLSARDFALAVLGSGDAPYMAFFAGLAARFPGRVAFRSGHDESLAHLIEAGSDMFLMPSRYEPCGLNQMYSLRYGTIPIVRSTGGLADSVQHFDPASGRGTGCVFNDYDVPAVRWAVATALDWFADPGAWHRLMQNAMAQDFSWSKQIQSYDLLYRGLSSR
ncbi:MAG TPA: glycogen synthase [Steroidobacteraceae bacterium]|jgi:starch synthase|nr:glycogen synthase [Steroidobacteraceae bacterium]